MEMNVGDGQRMSAAQCYLRPAIARGNVRVITGALVDKVIFDGNQATGVAFSVGNRSCRADCSCEVLLSAGSIMSPVILKRSGVGPANELLSHGIEVVHDNPQVGENLMDHLELYLQQECTQPVTLFPSLSLLGKARIGARWLLTKKGLAPPTILKAAATFAAAPALSILIFSIISCHWQFPMTARRWLQGMAIKCMSARNDPKAGAGCGCATPRRQACRRSSSII